MRLRSRGRRGRGHEVQPDRHRHRGRPGQRGAGPRAAARRASRRRDRRRGGQRATPAPAACVWIVDPIDGTVNYLYGLPALRGQHRGRGRRRGGGRGRARAGARPRVRRDPRRRRDLQRRADPPPARRTDGGAAGRHRLQLRAAGARPARRATSRSCSRGSATSAGSAPARSTSAGSPPAHLDAYVEEGAHIWDHAAAGLVVAEAGGTLEVTRSPGGKRLLICAPADGFAEFRSVVADAGFVHGEGPNGAPTSRELTGE